jgi:hypothetical protein
MTFPTVQIIQFDKDVDPSGVRNIPASGVGVLDTSITGCLDFGNANTTTSGIISETKMFVFSVSDLGSASGVYNLRFFLDNTSAFNTGNFRFLQKIATHHQGAGFQLLLTDEDTLVAEPTAQNVISTTPSSQPTLSGITDADVSQYVYLAVFVDRDVPFGTYGGCANGSFRYRMLYDFS